MDDQEVKKIVDITLDERKKRQVSKIFHDPYKAETIFMFLAGYALIATLIAVVGIAGLSSLGDDTKMIDGFLKSMPCDGLKQMYASNDLTYTQKTEIQRYILINCL